MGKFITKEYLENNLKVYNNTIVKPLVDSAVPANTFNNEDFSVDSQNKVSLLPARRVYRGTRADWDLLSVAEKTQYGATAFTDDEGGGMGGPVDVVEIGNMLAVTSNAVAKSLNYSTNEILTGGTWIDGKPIYRKVFTDPNNSWNASDSIIGNITNFKEPTSIKAIAFNDTGLQGWVENNEGGESRCYAYIKSNGEVHFYRYDIRDGTSYPKKVIIEYTKTTD